MKNQIPIELKCFWCGREFPDYPDLDNHEPFCRERAFIDAGLEESDDE